MNKNYILLLSKFRDLSELYKLEYYLLRFFFNVLTADFLTEGMKAHSCS